MTFRLFVYWCALCGGWAAAGGWALGWYLVRTDSLTGIGIKGMFLGMGIALALGLVDALWVFSLRQFWRIAPRVLVSVAVGTVGGLVGAFIGQLLFDAFHNQAALQIVGWMFTGLMVGVSLGTYDFLKGWVCADDLREAVRKLVRCVLGGALGGLLGGSLDWKMGDAWAQLFPGKSDLWSPSLTGFIMLGLCIGLWIGVAQVVLQQAWLTVESGFRKGRELLLNRPAFSIGRDESCDLGLFGDRSIDRMHACILQQGDHYLIADMESTTGTFVNGVRIQEPSALQAGDLIQVGNALLRFGKRKK